MNGQLLQCGGFEAGAQTGLWKRYHPSGELYDVGEYVQGKSAAIIATFSMANPNSLAWGIEMCGDSASVILRADLFHLLGARWEVAHVDGHLQALSRDQ